jgi:O-acetyl-ADP-ribose deacetylase (regulator of RNase III)
MKLTEINGDLFESKDNLAHCVSKDLRMGKGIAVKFKELFGNVDHLKSQDILVPHLKADDRYIFYLITKNRFFDKPTYKSLTASLEELKKCIDALGLTSVSMPQIGCGLDKLEWSKVLKIIHEIFADTDIAITVYHM